MHLLWDPIRPIFHYLRLFYHSSILAVYQVRHNVDESWWVHEECFVPLRISHRCLLISSWMRPTLSRNILTRRNQTILNTLNTFNVVKTLTNIWKKWIKNRADSRRKSISSSASINYKYCPKRSNIRTFHKKKNVTRIFSMIYKYMAAEDFSTIHFSVIRDNETAKFVLIVMMPNWIIKLSFSLRKLLQKTKSIAKILFFTHVGWCLYSKTINWMQKLFKGFPHNDRQYSLWFVNSFMHRNFCILQCSHERKNLYLKRVFNFEPCKSFNFNQFRAEIFKLLKLRPMFLMFRLKHRTCVSLIGQFDWIQRNSIQIWKAIKRSRISYICTKKRKLYATSENDDTFKIAFNCSQWISELYCTDLFRGQTFPENNKNRWGT